MMQKKKSDVPNVLLGRASTTGILEPSRDGKTPRGPQLGCSGSPSGRLRVSIHFDLSRGPQLGCSGSPSGRLRVSIHFDLCSCLYKGGEACPVTTQGQNRQWRSLSELTRFIADSKKKSDVRFTSIKRRTPRMPVITRVRIKLHTRHGNVQSYRSIVVC
jgi:hypothetical protein